MTPDAHAGTGRNRGPTLKGWGLGLAALIFLVVAAIYAFSTSFSYFAYYDDEGFMMISARGYLDGNALYDVLPSYYGPVYYFYKWILHSLVSLPLTHDFTRVLCIFHWLLAASVLALAAGRMTRSVLIGFFVFALAAVHLTPLAREPGHPQELAAVLMPLAILVAAGGLQRKWTSALLGVFGAAFVFMKINVGAFFGFALMLTLFCEAPLFQSRRALFWVALVLSSVLPFLVMRPHLAESWARAYSAQVCIAILTAGGVGYVLGGRRDFGLARLAQVAAGFAGLSVLIVAVLLLTGTSLPAMVENLITGPAKLASAFSVPLRVPYCSWSGAGALLAAVAVIAFRSRLDRLQFVIAAAKGIYGLLGAWLFVSDYNGQLGYLLPWSWLLLVPTRADRAVESRDAFARLFLCLLAAWQGLQAYPAAGTQAVLATLLPQLVYSLCLYDAIVAFARAPWAVQRLRGLTPRTVELLKALGLAGWLVHFSVNLCNPFSAWRYYASVPPLELPGARHLRLPVEQGGTYRALSQFLAAECDTFITIPGLNSLYLWTGKTTPTHFIISEVVLLNEGQQTQVVAALQQAKRPLIVLNEGTKPYAPGAGPLGELIRQHGREIRRIGGFRILELVKPGAQ